MTLINDVPLNRKLNLPLSYMTDALRKHQKIDIIEVNLSKTIEDTKSKRTLPINLWKRKNENISVNNLPKIPNGKKIKDIEITIKVASNYQKQKNN